MPKKTGSDFHKAAGGAQGPLTFVIRTDADHATSTLKANLRDYLARTQGAQNPALAPNMIVEKVERVVHEAYREWGHTMLQAITDSIDYNQYDLDPPAAGTPFNADFYNARALAAKAVAKGGELATQGQSPENTAPVLYVSLDDLIKEQAPNWGEMAFSRLFSIDGNSHRGYQARPGYNPLPEQIKALRDKVETLAAASGSDVSLVLLEDNVRHAKMLNWVITLMEEGGVFDHARLAGISTCFCCAPEEEREAIQWRGQTVPLAIVVDYKGEKVDVITPRDLLFDGYVVEIEGEKKRLPAPFMNLSKMFKIAADQGESFSSKVQNANLSFCRTVENAFNVFLPLEWFATADAIAHVTGYKKGTMMTQVLARPDQAQANENTPPRNTDNKDTNGPWQNPAP